MVGGVHPGSMPTDEHLGISSSMEAGKDDNAFGGDGVKNGERKFSQQDTACPAPPDRILQRCMGSGGNGSFDGAQELRAKLQATMLIPGEGFGDFRIRLGGKRKLIYRPARIFEVTSVQETKGL